MTLNQKPILPTSPRPIAIIGAGGIVMDAHLPAYTLAGWKVMGIYDLDFQKAESAKKQFGIVEQAFPDLDKLIQESHKEKAVFDLAVPADQLLDILQLLPDESAVLIQKPMGETLSQAEAIRTLCQRKKLVAAVNFQLKFAPYMLAAKDMIRQGLLGEIYDLELKVNVFTPWELWDFLKTKPRMEVLYHSVHYLDLIRSLVGDPSRVHASVVKSPKSPNLADARSSILLDYDEYTQARILTNHGHDFGPKHQESYLKIEGTKGAVKITIGLSLDYPKGKPSKMEYCIVDEGTQWKEIQLEGDWFPHAFLGSMAALQVHLENPETKLIHSFSDALQTMKLVEAVYQSSDFEGIHFNPKN